MKHFLPTSWNTKKELTLDDVERSEQIAKCYDYDMEHNEIFHAYWNHKAEFEARLKTANKLALKLGMDVNIWTNGVEYNSCCDCWGIQMYDSESTSQLKHHISLWTRIIHRAELHQIISTVQSIQREFSAFVSDYKPKVLAEAEHYRNHTIYIDGRETEISPEHFLAIDIANALNLHIHKAADIRRCAYEASHSLR